MFIIYLANISLFLYPALSGSAFLDSVNTFCEYFIFCLFSLMFLSPKALMNSTHFTIGNNEIKNSVQQRLDHNNDFVFNGALVLVCD